MKAALKALYFLGILVEVVIRVPHERRRRETRRSDERMEDLDLTLLGLFSVGELFVPVVYAATSWLDRADYRLSPAAERCAGGIGAALMVLALWLFWRSHADLGRNWSPWLELGDDQALVTEGVYRRVRHPMYASQWLRAVAQTLLLQNRVAGWAGLAGFAPLYAVRVPREERMMLDRFGDKYRAYMDRTGRVIPRLR